MAYSPKRGAYKGDSFKSESAYRTKRAHDLGFKSRQDMARVHKNQYYTSNVVAFRKTALHDLKIDKKGRVLPKTKAQIAELQKFNREFKYAQIEQPKGNLNAFLRKLKMLPPASPEQLRIEARRKEQNKQLTKSPKQIAKTRRSLGSGGSGGGGGGGGGGGWGEDEDEEEEDNSQQDQPDDALDEDTNNATGEPDYELD